MANLTLRKLLTDPREGVTPKDKIFIYVMNSDENAAKTIKLRGLYDSKITKVLNDFGTFEVTSTEYDVLNKIVTAKISPLL